MQVHILGRGRVFGKQSISVEFCSSVNPKLLALRDKVQAHFKKIDDDARHAQRQRSERNAHSLPGLLAKRSLLSDAEEDNKACVDFIADLNLPFRILSQPAFRDLVSRVQQRGQKFQITKPNDLGTVKGNLGPSMSSALDFYDKQIARMLQPLLVTPGTFCSDGARNIGVDGYNDCLQLPFSKPLHVQHQDVTGKYKNAALLEAHINKGLDLIKRCYVGILCLDGASVCKAVLEQFFKANGNGQIFGHRCSMHAINLLLEDIGEKLFSGVIKFVTDIVKFIIKKTRIKSLFEAQDNVRALRRPVDTRFCDTLYVVDLVLLDWDAIVTFLASHALKELTGEVPSDVPAVTAGDSSDDRQRLQAARRRLLGLMIDDAKGNMKSKIILLQEIETPLVRLLRSTDSESPNLSFIPFLYENACLEIMLAAEKNKDLIDTKALLNILCIRHRDVVSPVSLAAAYVNPVLQYKYSGGYDPFKPVNHRRESPLKTWLQNGGNGARQPGGGREALRTCLEQYFEKSGAYPDPPPDGSAFATMGQYLHAQAKEIDTAFRMRSGWFGGQEAQQIANTSGQAAFWQMAHGEQRRDSDPAFIFEKEATGFQTLAVSGLAGQGPVEKCNGAVKRTRTKLRNRLQPITTDALMRIRMARSADKAAASRGAREQDFLSSMRRKFQYAERVAVEAAALAGRPEEANDADAADEEEADDADAADEEEADDASNTLFEDTVQHVGDGDEDDDVDDDDDDSRSLRGAFGKAAMRQMRSELLEIAKDVPVPMDDGVGDDASVNTRWGAAFKERVRQRKVLD